MVYSDGKRLRMILRQSELGHGKAFQLVLIGEEIIELVLVVIAYCRYVEELDVVLERDPEAPIVDLLQVDLLFRALGPLVRLVTPVTLPLFSPPWVSDLNQSLRFSIIECDQFGPDQTVGVRIDQTN